MVKVNVSITVDNLILQQFDEEVVEGNISNGARSEKIESLMKDAIRKEVEN